MEDRLGYNGTSRQQMRQDYHTNPIEVCETRYALICRMMSAYVYHYPKRLVTGMVTHCKLGPTSSRLWAYLEIREPMKEVLRWFGNAENRQKQQGERTSQGEKYVWRDLFVFVLCILHFTSCCFLPTDVGCNVLTLPSGHFFEGDIWPTPSSAHEFEPLCKCCSR